MKRLTVFTPTYNRAYILPQLYQSLCEQTNKDFVWLIIDDGSTDTTKEIVSNWIEESIIDIEYIYQNNSGKMAAYNKALTKTETPLFLCIDSDDYLVSNGVEKILKAAIGIETASELSGIVAYRGKEDKSLLGNEFPQDLEYSPLKDLYKKGFEGDTTLIFKTDIAKKYLFALLPGEKFISEMYVYNQIDEKYNLKILREVLTVCNYLEDGYTKNGYSLVKNNPMGWALIYCQKKDYAKGFKERFRCAAFSGSYVMMASKAAKETAYKQGLYKIGILEFISWPMSLLLYLRRKWVHRYE